MNNLSQIERKNGGVTFTPSALADFLSERILFHSTIKEGQPTIMDPACGDGALLDSIAKKLYPQVAANYLGYDTIEDFRHLRFVSMVS
jgi:type I restriction-modification system DNA methylase subunit